MVRILIAPCSLPKWWGRKTRIHMNMNRRLFIAGCASASALKVAPALVKSAPGRRILTLVYDKSLGMMRAIDRVVP
jgi:hypothetical protein